MDPKKMALESWSLSRPKMVKALKKAGMLEEALQNAEDLAGDLISDLLSKGVPFEPGNVHLPSLGEGAAATEPGRDAAATIG